MCPEVNLITSSLHPSWADTDLRLFTYFAASGFFSTGKYLHSLYVIHSCTGALLWNTVLVSTFFFYSKWCKYLVWLNYRLSTGMHFKDNTFTRGQTRWPRSLSWKNETQQDLYSKETSSLKAAGADSSRAKLWPVPPGWCGTHTAFVIADMTLIWVAQP